ncbi:MAG: hypothetical protein OIF48_12730 [Silicimonas sp.]|nr:hypothetical protein [Silicimonas sp.]
MGHGVLSQAPVLAGALAALTALGGCGVDANGQPRYCERNPEICALAAIVIIGGITASDGGGGGSTSAGAGGGGSGGSGGSGGGSGGGGGSVSNASDPALKTDIQYLETLDNGLRLYAFRYHGQAEGFVGVLADELVEDPRFAHAVVPHPAGYLLVDYERLPVTLVNYAAMQAASDRALAAAGS